MKKIACFALAALMLLMLCACGAEKAPVTYGFLDETLGAEQYGLAFRAGDEELCAKIEAAVQTLVENGTYAEIAAKYPGIVNNLLFLNAK